MAALQPPIHETKFLRLTANHLELVRKLGELNIPCAALGLHAEHVGQSWFHLGDAHLQEAKVMLRSRHRPHRAIFSRSYYAAYSASKAVRYLVSGLVSLKGDDHGKATDLPADFPSKEQWAKAISDLYENRLRADYDNWLTTGDEFSCSSKEAVESAEGFLNVARLYINQKIGGEI